MLHSMIQSMMKRIIQKKGYTDRYLIRKGRNCMNIGGEVEKRKYLPSAEVAMFCEQIALILKSGIPLYDGVEALSNNYKDSKYSHIFEEIYNTVRETGSLYQAVKKVAIFPVYMVNMINIGEQAGKLDTIMEGLADYYEAEDRIKSTIKNAVIYPSILVMMMAAVIAVLVIKVLPIFNQVFRQLGADLPSTSLVIMSFGTAVGKGVLIVIGLLLGLILILAFLLNTRYQTRVLYGLVRVLPFLERLSEKIAVQRFSSVISMLMESGFPIGEAMKLVPDIILNKKIKNKIHRCNEDMDNQVPIAKAMVDVELFDKIHNKMVQIGFMSGQLDKVMKKLSVIYEEETEIGINKMLSFIEPTLVAILSIVIGAILLAVMLPMISIMSSIG